MEGGGLRANPLNGIASVYLFCLALSLLLFQSVIFSIFTPLPQMFCYLRLGRWAGLSIPLVMFIVTGFLGGGAGFGYLLQFAIPGVVLSETIIKKCSVEKSFLLALGITIATILISLSFYASGKGTDVGELVRTVVQSAVDETIAFNEKAGKPQEHLNDFKKAAPLAVEFASRLYLSIIVVIVMIMLWLNMLGLSRIMKRVGDQSPFGDLSCWRAPEYLVWGLIGAGIILVSGLEISRVAAINLLLVLFVVYFFQGMGVVSYFFNKKELSGFVKSVGYVFVVWYLGVLVIALGIFDLWFDFRKLTSPKEV